MLRLPAQWQLTTHWPSTPPPLTESDLGRALDCPAGQQPLRELCRGKSKPLVIVDDLNRPTPASCILPALLAQFQQAGIPARDVTILIATGTHAPPVDNTAVAKKLGPMAAAVCKVRIHDAKGPVTRIGKTSFGTRVAINTDVVSSDLVVGIGGVYPNQTAGFGGGTKLVLGVLGFRSIMQLHYRHTGMGWGNGDAQHTFRLDLDEIARMARLRTVISMHIDADCRVIRAVCGDPFLSYTREVEFARKTFSAPPPGDADVVISNAYPSDITLTSALMKGVTPLERAAPQASRIVVASCPAGIGHHGLFPLTGRSKFYRLQQIARRVVHLSSQDLIRKVVRKATGQTAAPHPVRRNPIRLYSPLPTSWDPTLLPSHIHTTQSWSEIVDAVQREHPGKQSLRAVLYPCAPLQILATLATDGDSSVGIASRRQENRG